MDNSRYPKRCYNYLKLLSDAGRISWASELKKLLCKYGFDELWESPSGCVENFISLFEDRVKEEYVKQWQAEIGESNKLTVYRSFKTNFLCESYLFDIEPSHLSRILTQFRISNHNSEVEIGRRDSVLMEDRICKICNQNGDIVLEDELHLRVGLNTEKDRKGPKRTEKDRKGPKRTEKDRKGTEKDRKGTEKDRKGRTSLLFTEKEAKSRR